MPGISEQICILELQFSPGGAPSEYAVAAMVRDPQTGERRHPQANIMLPVEQMRELRQENDDKEYRRKLAEYLFGGPEVHLKDAFNEARTIADVKGIPLRVRIIIDARSRELHGIVWELLGSLGLDAAENATPVPIATDERRYLSRYLNPPIKKIRQFSGQLRCVMLIANPRQLHGAPLKLDDIDVVRQCQVIDAQMHSEVETVHLKGAAASKRRLLEEIRQGADIVYLVCHGELIDDKPVLYFESDSRELEQVDGELLVEAIAGMGIPPPTLVVFGSCQSAGGGNSCENLGEGFLASIGALMISTGVPAVVGMQGAIEQAINEQFYDAFFRELFERGQVERATAAGRQAIRETRQWWMPALLLSKEDGQLWPPRASRDSEWWTTLLRNVERNLCVPILGSDVVHEFSNQEFLKALKDDVREEVSVFATNELPWMAQQWITIKPENICQRYESFIDDKIHKSGVGVESSESLQDAVCRWGKENPDAVSTLTDLASLPFSLYLTANPDRLLEEQLSTKGKQARSGFCPWQDNIRQIQWNDANLSDPLTPSKPCVYHLFGWLGGTTENQSPVALTEDDFFKHLIWISKNEGRLPSQIKTPLISSSLVFLGFNLRDWEFRTLIHCISQLGGAAMLGRQTHVAVQLPLETDFEERARMQRSLQEFYTKNPSIHLSIFYGSVKSFTSKLKRKWEERHPTPKDATCPIQELSK